VQASRIAAGVLALAAIAAFYGLLASPAFALRRLDIDGARFTGEDAVAAAAGLSGSPGPNAFAFDTEAVAAALRSLPAVIDVDVEVALPDLLRVRVVEREPVLAWKVGEAFSWVSADGVVLSREAVDAPEYGDLPVFVDERTGRPAPKAGGTVDPTDLAAARRLGSLTPEMAGSTADALSFHVTDGEGFVVTAPGRTWRAVFGIYTPTLRPPDVIPAQVQCLASLMKAQGEKRIDSVYLFPEGDRCGTFTIRKAASS